MSMDKKIPAHSLWFFLVASLRCLAASLPRCLAVSLPLPQCLNVSMPQCLAASPPRCLTASLNCSMCRVCIALMNFFISKVDHFHLPSFCILRNISYINLVPSSPAFFLTGNGIGDEGAKELARAICRNSTLTRLDLICMLATVAAFLRVLCRSQSLLLIVLLCLRKIF